MSKKDTKNTIKNATPGDEVIDENPDLQKMVEPDTDLKNWLVEYFGEKINLSTPNKSNHNNYLEYYNQESLDIVYDRFKIDFEKFDYKKI